MACAAIARRTTDGNPRNAEEARALVKHVESLFMPWNIDALVDGFTEDCVIRFGTVPEFRGRERLARIFHRPQRQAERLSPAQAVPLARRRHLEQYLGRRVGRRWKRRKDEGLRRRDLADARRQDRGLGSRLQCRPRRRRPAASPTCCGRHHVRISRAILNCRPCRASSRAENALTRPRNPSMPQTMSKSSLPVFEIVLNALSAILDKAEAYAGAKKIDPSVLLGMRLAPDMFALTRQVQVACDQAKNGSARLAGVEPPKFEDNEIDDRAAQGAHRQDRRVPQDARHQGDRCLSRPRNHLSARAEERRRCRATTTSITSCCRISISTPRRLTRSCVTPASRSASAISSAAFRSSGS